MNYQEQKYTVSFIFNSNYSKVLLVHKLSPEWQKGRVNGVGGKYEQGETAAQCVARETEEETALVIPEKEWVYIGTIEQPQGDVGILAAQYAGPESDAKQSAHETIEWFPVDELPANCMKNLPFLIPLALLKLREDYFETFTITYTN